MLESLFNKVLVLRVCNFIREYSDTNVFPANIRLGEDVLKIS